MSVESVGRLTPDEDAALRRLNFFRSVGVSLAPELAELEADLRARDLRTEVRDAEPTAILVPPPRTSH